MAKTCGAKTRSGEPCKRAPAEGRTRCRLHGGASPRTNKNAVKTGIYSSALLPGEDAIEAGLRGSVGAVDDELFVARLRLRRALAAEAKSIQTNDFLVVDSETQRDGGGAAYAASETNLKRVDYTAIIDRLTARIESLEKTRAELAKNNPPADEPVTRIEIEVVGAKK